MSLQPATSSSANASNAAIPDGHALLKLHPQTLVHRSVLGSTLNGALLGGTIFGLCGHLSSRALSEHGLWTGVMAALGAAVVGWAGSRSAKDHNAWANTFENWLQKDSQKTLTQADLQHVSPQFRMKQNAAVGGLLSAARSGAIWMGLNVLFSSPYMNEPGFWRSDAMKLLYAESALYGLFEGGMRFSQLSEQNARADMINYFADRADQHSHDGGFAAREHSRIFTPATVSR